MNGLPFISNSARIMPDRILLFEIQYHELYKSVENIAGLAVGFTEWIGLGVGFSIKHFEIETFMVGRAPA